MNKKHAGKMLVWNAGKTHQFNKDTVIQYLRRLVAPAFREKRKRLKLQHKRGLLIWDAFGGAKAIATKEERKEWEDLLNVDILGPEEMTRDSSAPVVLGGWSAPGQPNDYFHVYWHKLTMARERVIVNWHRNLLLRKALDDLVLNRFTTAAPKVELEDALECDRWAWENIPTKLIRYAWRSRGYTDEQKQAEMFSHAHLSHSRASSNSTLGAAVVNRLRTRSSKAFLKSKLRCQFTITLSRAIVSLCQYT
jgi:hypothetical protein